MLAPQINFSHQRAEIDAKFQIAIYTQMEPFPIQSVSIGVDIKAILDFKLVNTFPRKIYPRLNDLIVDFSIDVGTDVAPVSKHLTILNEFIHAIGNYIFKPVINTALSTGIELPQLGEFAYVSELGFEQDSMWLAVKMRSFG